MSRFAWQGFSFLVNEFWRPVTLSGSRKTGYVRLEGEKEDAIQVRWQFRKSQPPDLRPYILEYFSALEKSARKRKLDFKGELKSEDTYEVFYEWHAGLKGYGKATYDGSSRRVFLIEYSGRKQDSLKKLSKNLVDGFEIHQEELIPWEILGLKINLPWSFQLEEAVLLSGKISLTFKSKKNKISTERWGFAEQLIKQHGFEKLTQNLTGLQNAEQIDDNRILLTGKPSMLEQLMKMQKTALVKFEKETNNLICVVATHIKSESPKWEWIT